MSLTNGETEKLLSTTGAAQGNMWGWNGAQNLLRNAFYFSFLGKKKKKSETNKKPTQNLNLQFLPLK